MSDQFLFSGFETEIEVVRSLSLPQAVERAISLIQKYQPADSSYYLAFSGGKDSCVIKKLAQLSGVRFESFYNQTTIDPPELVRFIKEHHKDVKWNIPKMNMMSRVATKPSLPPTRGMRWCCEEYKEHGGDGRVKLFGVRAEESAARAKRWKEVAEDTYKNLSICPIVFWTKEMLWGFIHSYSVPYCSLYDEGWERLGCVGCPLATLENQKREFKRWPAFERNWKKAIIANWEKYKDLPRERDGLPRRHAAFKSGEDFWQWWLTAKTPDYLREDCQSGLLWTNEGDAGE